MWVVLNVLKEELKVNYYKLNSGSTNFILLQCALEATTHIFFTLNTPEHGCSSARFLGLFLLGCLLLIVLLVLRRRRLVLSRRRHQTLFVLLLLLVSKQREALLSSSFCRTYSAKRPSPLACMHRSRSAATVPWLKRAWR